MALDETRVLEKITAQFGDKVKLNTESLDMLCVEVEASIIHDFIQFLRDDATLRFNFLTTLCGMHYPANEVDRQFGVTYHMHNWMDNFRMRIKVYLEANNPEIDTVCDLFLSANWQERETYDFYGIIFLKHPDLKRILNMDEMVSFPMRKDFPLEDQDRTDKDDRYFGRIPVNQINN